MPLNFKHINANEQIFDGSIGTSLIADGAITAAKLAAGSIPSSSLIIDSNVDFNNFQALQFRVENVDFFPTPGNPGRLIWRTDLRDLYVDTDFALNITAARFIPFKVQSVLSPTSMSVNSTAGMVIGDGIFQGGVPFGDIEIVEIVDLTHIIVDSTIGVTVGDVIAQDNASTTVTTITDSTHLIVASTVGFVPDVAVVSTPYVFTTITTVADATHLTVANTAGFIGRATANVNFGIVTVTDATHLEIDNSTAISVGDVIQQGAATTTVTAVTDLTHIIVTSTVGFSVGITDVLVLIDINAIPSSTQLTVSKTTGFGPGNPLTQGVASTTVISVVDATHLIVGSTAGFAVNSATDSTVVVDDTSSVNAGMLLTQGVNSSLILNVIDATHLAVVNATPFVAGPAFTGNWVALNDGGSVNSIRSDANPQLQGNITLASGTNVDLIQLSQTITVDVPAAGITGQIQFNDGLDVFGADPNLFWDNINKRLGIKTSAPSSTLDVAGDANVDAAMTIGDTLDVVAATTLNDTLHVIGAVTADSTLDVAAATTLNDTLTVTNNATFGDQVGIGTLTPDASASLEVLSTTRGVLIPRLTTAQMNAIVSPAIGLMIYNTTMSLFNFWTGLAWLPVGSPVGNIGDVQFNAGGGLFGADPIFHWDDLNNRLGIGTATPTTTLDIVGDTTITGNTVITGDETLTGALQIIDDLYGALHVHSVDSSKNFLVDTTQPIAFLSDGVSDSALTLGLNPFDGLAHSGIDIESHIDSGITLRENSLLSTGWSIIRTATGGYGELQIKLADSSATPMTFNATGDEVTIVDKLNINNVYARSGGDLNLSNFDFSARFRAFSDGHAVEAAVNGNTWTFDSAGVLTTPSTVVIGPTATDYLKLVTTPGSGVVPDLIFQADAGGEIAWTDSTLATTYSEIQQLVNDNLHLVQLQAGQGIRLSTVTSNWTFNDAGTLTFPLGSNLSEVSVGYWLFSGNGTGNAQLNSNPGDDLSLQAAVGAGGAALVLRATGDILLVPTAPSNVISAQTHKITDVVNPTAAQDAATKNYVDGPSHTVAGANTQIQYNDLGNFGASSGMTYDAGNVRIHLNDGSPAIQFNNAPDTIMWGIVGANINELFIETDGAAQNVTIQTNAGTRVWTFDPTGKLNLPGGDAFRNIDSSPTAIGNLDITTAGALNLRTTNGSGLWVTDNGTITQVGINNNTPVNALDVHGETLLTADTSNFQLRITDTLTGTRAGLRLVSASSTFGVIELEGAENNANLQIRASADTTDIAISSIANLHIDAATIGWTFQTDGRISSSLTEILFDRSLGVTNDNGGFIFFNSANNAHTYANLVAGNDDTFKITGQNDISKWFINSGYIVFGLNDFTQETSSFLTVNGQTAVVGGSLKVRQDGGAFFQMLNASDNDGYRFYTNGGTNSLLAIAHETATTTPVVITDSGSLYVGSPAVAVAPDASAKFQVDSTTKGLLTPRMTSVQRNAIPTPATGLVVYDTTLNLLQLFNGTSWTTVGQALFEQDIFDITGPGNVFNLSFTPITNSQVVYYNGLALAPGATEDYTIAANVVTLNGSIVLANGDKILVVYSHY